jgi:hypothetical protein
MTPTLHFRINYGTLEQLWLADKGDLVLFEGELDRVDEDVFREERTPRGYLDGGECEHEWRAVESGKW